MGLVGRRGCDAARGDRCGADAADVDFRHRQVERAQRRIGQPVVVPEAATHPMAPIEHTAAGRQLEGRFAAVDRLRGRKSTADDLALGEDIAADLGDPDAAGRALDEADAQLALELSHRLLSFDLGLPVAREAAEKPPWRTTCAK